MPKYNIVAGTKEDIRIDSGEWLIIDIGYGKNSATNAIWQSGEILGTPGTIRSVHYRDVKPLVIEAAQRNPCKVLHLAIEAPLSAAFDGDGDPTTRFCDKLQKPGEEKFDTRPWFNNSGSSTLVLAEFLLRELHKDNIGKRWIKLFEGHVSFKFGKSHKPRFRTARNRHEADVLAIKHEIQHKNDCNIFDKKRLRMDQDITLKTPFGFLGKDLIPPVIRVPPPSHFPKPEDHVNADTRSAGSTYNIHA